MTEDEYKKILYILNNQDEDDPAETGGEPDADDHAGAEGAPEAERPGEDNESNGGQRQNDEESPEDETEEVKKEDMDVEEETSLGPSDAATTLKERTSGNPKRENRRL